MAIDTDNKADKKECPVAESETDLLLGENVKREAVAAVHKENQVELLAFLQKARSAADDYTAQKYNELVGRWIDQDGRITKLVAGLDQRDDWQQSIPAVCALFTAIQEVVDRLEGCPPDEPPTANAQQAAADAAAKAATQDESSKLGLYADRATLQTRRDREKRALARVRLELAAWEKPAQTLEKILNEHFKLIEECTKLAGRADAALAYDVFFKLVPVHLHITPKDATSTVKPLEAVLKLVKPEVKDCTDAAIRQLAPQPRLIKPSAYPQQVDLVAKAMNTAIAALAEAEGEVKKNEDAINRNLRALDYKKKSLDKDARGALQEAAKPDADPAAKDSAAIAQH
jgi:hypothetical protein